MSKALPNIQICLLIIFGLLIGFFAKSIIVVICQYLIFVSAIFYYCYKLRLSSAGIVADAVARKGSIVHLLMQHRIITFVFVFLFSLGMGFHLLLWIYTVQKIAFVFILLDIVALYFIDKVAIGILEKQLNDGPRMIMRELGILFCNSIVLIAIFTLVEMLAPSPVARMAPFDPAIADIAASEFSHSSKAFQRLIRTILFIRYNVESMNNDQGGFLNYIYWIVKILTLPILTSLGVSILIRSAMQLPYKMKVTRD